MSAIRKLLFALLAILAIWLTVPAHGAEVPKILIGLDAQPVENFDIAASVGNALHRYDNGPQHNVTLEAWLTRAQVKNLLVMAQGLQFANQNVDPAKFWNVVSVTQDDEPDMNRWNPAKPNPDLFSPTDAPHPGCIGWTRPAVLAARYADWKARWPGTQISVNFAGPSLSNGYYSSALIYHLGYIKASDAQGFDLYPKNNQGDGGNLYWPAAVFDKMKVVGNPQDVYIETSDQSLDGSEGGGAKRGPTPNEQGTLVWSALGHGAKRLWYFPQRIGSASSPSFKYYNVSAANEARAKQDYADISRYMSLLGNGTRTTVAQTPKAQTDLNKGVQVWPVTETFKWELGSETLVATVDYTGARAPVLVYNGVAAMPATQPVVLPVTQPTTLPSTQPATQPTTQPASKVLQEIRFIYGDGSTESFVRKP